MVYRLIALMFLILGLSLGLMVVWASGANVTWKYVMGIGVPTLAGLIFAIAWWRKGAERGVRSGY